MARIRHLVDQDTEMPIRLTGGLESPEAFPESGEKVVSDERAEELTNHPLIELVDDGLPSSYQQLQHLAAAAESAEVSGNDSEEEIVRYLSGLDVDELTALAEEAGVDPDSIDVVAEADAESEPDAAESDATDE